MNNWPWGEYRKTALTIMVIVLFMGVFWEWLVEDKQPDSRNAEQIYNLLYLIIGYIIGNTKV